jgi:hypothetical protein
MPYAFLQMAAEPSARAKEKALPQQRLADRK